MTTSDPCEDGQPQRSESLEAGKEEILRVLKNGQALKKFHAMLLAQGVHQEAASELAFGNPDKVLKGADTRTEFKAREAGTIVAVKAVNVAT